MCLPPSIPPGCLFYVLSDFPTPVLIGSSSEADILLAEQDSPVPVMAKITLADGVVRLEDGPTQSTRPLGDGEILTYGATRIQLRASGDAAEGTREREETPSLELRTTSPCPTGDHRSPS